MVPVLGQVDPGSYPSMREYKQSLREYKRGFSSTPQYNIENTYYKYVGSFNYEIYMTKLV